MDIRKLTAVVLAAALLTGCSGNSGSSDAGSTSPDASTSASESTESGSSETRKTVLASGYAEDSAEVAAITDCEPVTFGEFIKEYRYFLWTNGITDDTAAEYADYLTARREYIVNYLINEKIVQKKFNELCEPFTEEELSRIQSSYDSKINELYSSMAEGILNNSDSLYTDETLMADVDAAFNQFLVACGMTTDDIYSWAYSDFQRSKLVNTVCTDVTLEFSEAEKQAKEIYDGVSEQYKSDPASYVASDYASLFIPEGSRNVQHILLRFSNDDYAAIIALRDEGKDAEADALRAEKAADFDEKKAGILAKISAGEDFGELMKQYSDDGDVTATFLVSPGTEQFIEGFAECVFAIGEVGGISECVSDYGVHIVKYTEEATVSEETYSNTVEGIYQYMLSNAKNEKFSEYMTQWREDYPFTIDRELLLLSDE